MVECPLCSASFDGAIPYRDHLADAHDLEDDEGTATVLQIEPPESTDPAADDALTLMAAAMLDTPQAPPNGDGAVAGTNGARPAVPAVAPAAPVRMPAATPSGRYPLATRYGDAALYAPGLVLLLIAAARLEMDVLGAVFLLLGAAFIVLGMLLPLVHGRR